MKNFLFFLLFPLLTFGNNLSQNNVIEESLKKIKITELKVYNNTENTKYRFFNSYKNYEKKKHIKKARSTFTQSTLSAPIEITLDVETVYNYLDEILKEKGFSVDTTKNLFANNYLNSMLLNVAVDSMTIHTIKDETNGMVYVELQMEWELLDYYNVSVHSKRTTATSTKVQTFKVKRDEDFYEKTKRDKGNLVFTRRNNSEKIIEKEADEGARRFRAVHIAIKDAIKKNFVKFTKIEKVANALKYTKEEVEVVFEEAITFLKPNTYVSDLSQAVKSSLTIKTKNGHGSGFIVSTDGYIITSYHVLMDSTDVKVVLNDESEYAAKIVRLNPNYDLALLKIESKNLIPFQLSTSKDIEIAAEIYAIGTPTAEDLSQTISTGIVSGIRKLSGKSKLIQTDASVNSGSSGGPILNKEGLVLGVVSSKLSGFGIEGVAFGVPAYEILNKLNIEIKQ